MVDLTRQHSLLVVSKDGVISVASTAIRVGTLRKTRIVKIKEITNKIKEIINKINETSSLCFLTSSSFKASNFRNAKHKFQFLFCATRLVLRNRSIIIVLRNSELMALMFLLYTCCFLIPKTINIKLTIHFTFHLSLFILARLFDSPHVSFTHVSYSLHVTLIPFLILPFACLSVYRTTYTYHLLIPFLIIVNHHISIYPFIHLLYLVKFG